MKKFKLVFFLVIAIITAGCTLPISDDSQEVFNLITTVLKEQKFAEVFKNSVFDMKYSVCTDSEKSLLDAYFKKCKVMNVVYDKETELFTISFSVPGIESIHNSLSANQLEISTDLKKMQLKGASDEEITACIQRNVANLIMNGTYTEEEQSVKVYYDAETGKLDSDVEVCKMLFCVVEQEYVVAIDNQAVADSIEIEKISPGDSFTCSYNDHSILVSGIQVLSGAEALKAICSLSTINSKVQFEPGCVGYYISYKITNLSNEEIVFSNAFVASAGGKLLENAGFSPVGLHDVENIAPSETKDISCFIVCTNSSVVVWYSPVSDLYLGLDV